MKQCSRIESRGRHVLRQTYLSHPKPFASARTRLPRSILRPTKAIKVRPANSKLTLPRRNKKRSKSLRSLLFEVKPSSAALISSAPREINMYRSFCVLQQAVPTPDFFVSCVFSAFHSKTFSHHLFTQSLFLSCHLWIS